TAVPGSLLCSACVCCSSASRFVVFLPLLPSLFSFQCSAPHRDLHSFPTRRSSDLAPGQRVPRDPIGDTLDASLFCSDQKDHHGRSEEHTSELQSRFDLVCRLLLEKKNAKHAKLCSWPAPQLQLVETH